MGIETRMEFRKQLKSVRPRPNATKKCTGHVKSVAGDGRRSDTMGGTLRTLRRLRRPDVGGECWRTLTGIVTNVTLTVKVMDLYAKKKSIDFLLYKAHGARKREEAAGAELKASGNFEQLRRRKQFDRQKGELSLEDLGALRFPPLRHFGISAASPTLVRPQRCGHMSAYAARDFRHGGRRIRAA
ncbi:hypothetical protein EVAR_94997_1 [Eumeta japonica]|uniref:Uncharacterized protein n=1 Tax=Eumeta variegata TaxID=151549 RepID=A0A4C1UVY7_EUMVA|nr:hypothetical protein EVAR_94997_1 [Eumeta japonica]